MKNKTSLLSGLSVIPENRWMIKLGSKLRERARALGLEDSTVASRAGLGQQRYASYVADRHRPDFETLLRICEVLQATPNDILGVADQEATRDEAGLLVARVNSALVGLSTPALRLAAQVCDAISAEFGRPQA